MTPPDKIDLVERGDSVSQDLDHTHKARTEKEPLALTLAAGAIFDEFSGGKIDWRSRVAADKDDDLFRSADWETAMRYARAALAATAPLHNEMLSALQLARTHIAVCPCSPSSGCTAARDRITVDIAIAKAVGTSEPASSGPTSAPQRNSGTDPKATGAQS